MELTEKLISDLEFLGKVREFDISVEGIREFASYTLLTVLFEYRTGQVP